MENVTSTIRSDFPSLIWLLDIDSLLNSCRPGLFLSEYFHSASRWLVSGLNTLILPSFMELYIVTSYVCLPYGSFGLMISKNKVDSPGLRDTSLPTDIIFVDKSKSSRYSRSQAIKTDKGQSVLFRIRNFRFADGNSISGPHAVKNRAEIAVNKYILCLIVRKLKSMSIFWFLCYCTE